MGYKNNANLDYIYRATIHYIPRSTIIESAEIVRRHIDCAAEECWQRVEIKPKRIYSFLQRLTALGHNVEITEIGKKSIDDTIRRKSKTEKQVQQLQIPRRIRRF